ncbi:MAG: hypothetical protein ACOCVN_00335 [bacterium]
MNFNDKFKKLTIILLIIASFAIIWLHTAEETTIKNDGAGLQKFVNDCTTEAGGFIREDQLGEIIIKVQYTKKKINKSLDQMVQNTCPKAAAKYISE